MEDIRDKKQKEIVDFYITKSMLRSTLVIGTGLGKGRISCDIIKAIKPKKVLILVNSLDLKDNMWPDELKKWGLEDLDCKIETYQTAWKWDHKVIDLKDYFCILDEVDFSGDTEKYSQFVTNYSSSQILGLTGFVTEDKRSWFEDYLPIIYEYDTTQAQEEGLLNKIHFKFVKYALSNIKNKKIEYKRGGKIHSFMTSDNDAYNRQDKIFRTLIGQQETLRNTDYMPKEVYDSEMATIQKKIEWAIQARNAVLLDSQTSADIAKEILKEELALDENKKVIVFSLRTKQSAKICDYVYNGSAKKVENEENFRNFNSSAIRSLGVCSKVNRGVNFKGLNTAIFESFYGSDTQMVQKLGRLRRLHVDEKATAYVLLPYFYRKNADGSSTLVESQQVKWSRKALKGIATKANSEIIDKIFR